MSEFRDFTHLFNDLPKEERARLMPHMMESQLLHIEQVKLVLVRSHRKALKEINDWQNNIRKDLVKYKEELNHD